MSDRKVSVIVEIDGKNKVGPAAKAAADEIKKAQQAAAADASGAVSDASGEKPAEKIVKAAATAGAAAATGAVTKGTGKIGGMSDADKAAVAKADAESRKGEDDSRAKLRADLFGPSPDDKAVKTAAAAGAAAATGAVGGATPSSFAQKQAKLLQQQADAIGAEKYGKARDKDAAAAAAGALPGQQQSGVIDKLQESFKKLSGTILLATGAATGFLAAGNPFLFGTFTASIKILSIQISRFLIPAFVSASGVIQNIARRIEQMDEGTRASIGAILKWGAVLSIGTIVAVKAVGAITAVGGAIKSLWAVMAAGAANPMVLAIMGAVAAVGVLAYKLGLLDGIMDKLSGRDAIFKRPLDDIGRSVHGAIQQRLGEPASENVNTASRWTGGALASMGPHGMAAATLLDGLGLSHEGGNRRTLDSVLPTIATALKRQGVNEDQIKLRIDAIRGANLQIHTAEGMRRASQIAQTQRDDDGNPLLTANGFQARSYQSGADFYSSLLEGALGMGSAEQKILTDQLLVQQETLRQIQSQGERDSAKVAELMAWASSGGSIFR